MSNNNPNRKARQWSFVIPSYNSETINRLSYLAQDDFVYVIFAICDDDTNNSFIQGLIRTHRPSTASELKKKIGNAIFSVMTHHPHDVLMDIRLNKSFVQLGETPLEDYEGEVASLKCEVHLGERSIENLLQTYPHLAQYAHHILRYINNINRNQPVAVQA